MTKNRAKWTWKKSLLLVILNHKQVKMGPDLTRDYFWPTVNKRRTRLWPGYFLTRPKEIFLTWSEKIEKFDVFRQNFTNSNPNHKWMTPHDPTRATKIGQSWPGIKYLTRTHHYKQGSWFVAYTIWFYCTIIAILPEFWTKSSKLLLSTTRDFLDYFGINI